MSEPQTFLQLCDLADITMGQSPDSANCNTEERGLPFLQGCAEFGKQSPSTEVYCHQPLRASKPDSILMSVRAPVGKLNWGEQGYCIGRGLGAIKAKLGISDTRFLGYSIEQNVAFLHRRSQGSTFSAIGTNDIKIFPIPAVSYEKQKKISFILGTIDQTIEKTEALIEKYQQIKAGLMHDLFTRGIGADGQLRPPREQAPELYQHTPMGWIPKEWAVKSMDYALESIVDGPFGSNLKTEHYVVDAGVRVVRLQNVVEFDYNDNDKAYISERHANFLLRNKVVSGDVLIAGLGEERYPVGRACCYPDNLASAINKADCFRARCKLDVMKNRFLMLFLNSGLARRQVRRYEQGVTRPRINTGNFKRLNICVPNLEEQAEIVAKFDAVQSMIQVELSNVTKLREQKSGLMHDLLTGKVQVNVNPPEASHG